MRLASTPTFFCFAVTLSACAGSQAPPPQAAPTRAQLGDGHLEIGVGIEANAAVAVLEAAADNLALCDGNTAREATTLAWIVERDGRSAMVQVESGSDPSYDGCLIAQLGRLRFPAPSGTDFVDLRYHRNARAQPADSSLPRAAGVILPDVIADAMRPTEKLIGACYNMRADSSSSPSGRVVLSWRIQPNGEPSAVTVLASELSEPAIERCLVAVIWNTVFPKPAGGAVEVSFPFSFQPD